MNLPYDEEREIKVYSPMRRCDLACLLQTQTHNLAENMQQSSSYPSQDITNIAFPMESTLQPVWAKSFLPCERMASQE